MQDATAGDPIEGVRSGHAKSLLETVSDFAAARLSDWTAERPLRSVVLREQRFLLRTNRKCQAGTHHPDRNRQFRYLARQRRRFMKKGWPVIQASMEKEGVDRQFQEIGPLLPSPKSQRRWIMTFAGLCQSWRPCSLMVFTMRAGTLAMSRIGTSLADGSPLPVATIRRWEVAQGRVAIATRTPSGG